MPIISRKPLSRRAMLRSTGACVALPFLEAMLPRSVSAQSTFRAAPQSVGPQPRMIFCYVPNGVNEEEWMPKTVGAGWSLSPTLQTVSDYREDFTVVSGLGHPNSKGGHAGADTWLTGANLEGTPGKDYQNAISID